jgi:beta-glucosidase
MKNRTYRYFKGDVLYPFGYGLSYTTFKYSNLTVPAQALTGKKIMVSAQVTNTGKIAGDEVAELYVKHLTQGIRKPLLALQGFSRIHLNAGETKTVYFTLTPAQLALVDKTDSWRENKGPIQISVGGSQPGEKNVTTGNVLSKTISLTGNAFNVNNSNYR